MRPVLISIPSRNRCKGIKREIETRASNYVPFRINLPRYRGIFGKKMSKDKGQDQREERERERKKEHGVKREIIKRRYKRGNSGGKMLE